MTDQTALPQIPFCARPSDALVTCGMPDETGLKESAQLGIKTVVNLCPANETPLTEPGTVAALGMTYFNIPVAGPQDLNRHNAERLAEILNNAETPVMVHCQSSNRVGALLALKSYWIDGADQNTAMAAGKAAGLTKLEEVTRMIMRASQ